VNVRAVHYPLMDSIRAIALLTVIAAHTSFFIAKNGDQALQHVRFDFGVRVFFMISAFLLYRPFVRALVRGWPAPSVKAFAWRRGLRILPAYWIALTAIAIWLSLSDVFSAGGIPTYYGFLQIYSPERAVGGLPQAWSLCVEVVFYLLLPVYAWVMRRLPAADERERLRHQIWGAALLAGLSLAYKVAIGAAGTLEDGHLAYLQTNPLAFLDDFALGMLLAAASVHQEATGSLARPFRLVERRPAVAWAVAIAALVVVSTALGLTGQLGEPVQPRQYMERHYLFTIVAIGLVLPAMFGDPRHGLVRRLLGWRPLLYLGMISYGVYLYHFAVLRQLEDWGLGSLGHRTTNLIWFPMALAGGMLLASLSYHGAERPILRLKRLVPDRRAAQPGEALAEPAPVTPGAP
jgi:peptidoglycan/LPS O-acetylase OafA/YrhL